MQADTLDLDHERTFAAMASFKCCTDSQRIDQRASKYLSFPANIINSNCQHRMIETISSTMVGLVVFRVSCLEGKREE